MPRHFGTTSREPPCRQPDCDCTDSPAPASHFAAGTASARSAAAHALLTSRPIPTLIGCGVLVRTDLTSSACDRADPAGTHTRSRPADLAGIFVCLASARSLTALHRSQAGCAIRIPAGSGAHRNCPAHRGGIAEIQLRETAHGIRSEEPAPAKQAAGPNGNSLASSGKRPILMASAHLHSSIYILSLYQDLPRWQDDRSV